MGWQHGRTLRNHPQKLQAVVLKKKIITFNVSLGVDFFFYQFPVLALGGTGAGFGSHGGAAF